MYDAKQIEETEEKVEKKEDLQKCNCIMERAYFSKSEGSIFNLKSSHIPNENTFF